MNIVKKEEVSTNPKLDKLNSSDTECLKSSNEKIIDILTKSKIEKVDGNIRITTISTKEKEKEKEKANEDEEESSDDNDDDNIKIENKSIDIIKTTVSEVLNQTKIEPKENLNLLKFNLCFLVKKEFKWEVYHTPDEVQKFLKKIYKFIKHDENAIKVVDLPFLEKIK